MAIGASVISVLAALWFVSAGNKIEQAPPSLSPEGVAQKAAEDIVKQHLHTPATTRILENMVLSGGEFNYHKIYNVCVALVAPNVSSPELHLANVVLDSANHVQKAGYVTDIPQGFSCSDLKGSGKF